MKQTLVTITALLFAGSLQAASDVEVYHGFAAGNPELSTDGQSARTTEVAMIRPFQRLDAMRRHST